LLRRVALIVAAAANVWLFAVYQSLSESGPAMSRGAVARKFPPAEEVHDRHSKPRTAPRTGEDRKKIITVPISLYRRLSIASAWDLFDTESATLNASGNSILGIDEATQNEVSKILRAAADRQVAIQKKFAQAAADGEGWKIEVPSSAHDAKSASLQQLESELRAVLPEEKAKLISGLAGFYILLGNQKDTQTFTVKWSGGGVDFSTRSSAYCAGGMMALPIFRKSLQYSWIEDVVVRAGGTVPHEVIEPMPQ
jgi:hypothetical protein